MRQAIHLDSGDQNLLIGGLLHKGRGLTMDGPELIGICMHCKCQNHATRSCMIVPTDGTLLIDWLADDIQNAAQGSTTDGDL